MAMNQEGWQEYAHELQDNGYTGEDNLGHFRDPWVYAEDDPEDLAYPFTKEGQLLLPSGWSAQTQDVLPLNESDEHHPTYGVDRYPTRTEAQQTCDDELSFLTLGQEGKPSGIEVIFPGTQFEELQEAMQGGLTVTLFGADIHAFMERIHSTKPWSREEKYHLLIMTNAASSPPLYFRRSRATTPTAHEASKWIRDGGEFRHVDEGLSRHFWRDDQWSLQLPGMWRNYSQPAQAPPKDLIRMQHEVSYSNRRIFAHNSANNFRGNMIKMDTVDNVVVEWVRPFPGVNGQTEPDQLGTEQLYLPHDRDEDNIKAVGSPHFLYSFLHHRRTEKDMQQVMLTDQGGSCLEYVNLHERTLVLRKAPIVRSAMTTSVTPFERFTRAPWRHCAIVDLAYKIDQLDTNMSGDKTWPSTKMKVQDPFGAVHFYAVFQLAACAMKDNGAHHAALQRWCAGKDNRNDGNCCDELKGGHLGPPLPETVTSENCDEPWIGHKGTTTGGYALRAFSPSWNVLGGENYKGFTDALRKNGRFTDYSIQMERRP